MAKCDLGFFVSIENIEQRLKNKNTMQTILKGNTNRLPWSLENAHQKNRLCISVLDKSLKLMNIFMVFMGLLNLVI